MTHESDSQEPGNRGEKKSNIAPKRSGDRPRSRLAGPGSPEIARCGVVDGSEVILFAHNTGLAGRGISWSTWSAVINLTSRAGVPAGELRSAPSGPDDRHRATSFRPSFRPVSEQCCLREPAKFFSFRRAPRCSRIRPSPPDYHPTTASGRRMTASVRTTASIRSRRPRFAC